MKHAATGLGGWFLAAATVAALCACGASSDAPQPSPGPQGGATAAGGAGGAGGGGGEAGSGASTGGPGSDDDGDGYSEIQGDCNDQNADIHPGAIEICDDGIDNNCNAAKDAAEPDADGDGFGPCQGDCNDADLAVSPAATELPGDGIDNNCDGIVDGDYDGDGYTEAAGDCNDQDPAVHPGAKEICLDGIDNDCNGFKDQEEPDLDLDGAGPCGGDCAEGDASIGPNAPELPGDGIDNNCDNLVDLDIDGDGWTVPNGDCDDIDPKVNPGVPEDCNDKFDNNCNGIIDADCLTPCMLAEMMRSSVGCVYYAVDADQYPGYDNMPYAVVVSNIDAKATANVEVQIRSGNVWQKLQAAAVGPGTLHEFGLPDRHIDNTGMKVAGAYKVVSDLPVIAYQFQPIDGVTSYTSDASLLLPTSALDQYYYVVGWGKPGAGNPQVTFVAVEDGTKVTMTPTGNTVAGGGIPKLAQGQAYTFPQAFNAGDYVTVESTDTIMGTYVTADKPISVFANHWCANIPQMVCCCDHVEEQLIGLQAWGKYYVGGRMPVLNTPTPDATVWHLFASEDNTTVNFTASPQVTGLPPSPKIMKKGEALLMLVGGSVQNPGDFVVKADKPIFLMEYLSSEGMNNAPTEKGGDPAMTQAVPVEQFLDHYVVLIPKNWVYDYFILTKPVGATVSIDGKPVGANQFLAISDGKNPAEWEVARLLVPDGVHKLAGDKPFGVVVVGFDSWDSYAYPGGMNQLIINPIK
ncbi:MAG: hypothetical protein HY744_10345 [Deltaproteobacteria bacterium]|nr:hypothetical protein [Deltaproteobacteria bacterium]